MPKVVHSRTSQAAGPNATIVRDVVAEEVPALKASATGTWWWAARTWRRRSAASA
ncbi:hypothetical protein [Saccharothrix luteola]|uniref:hypothetical protein n=1 Tax=Saccharothrix luteola TaxID=2893018 RepID=UPI001E4474F1|nr:hypothetical protein [Saccharothrix luteola]MCC8247751.1 hypothetical protein [Saccharothrix luteola]